MPIVIRRIDGGVTILSLAEGVDAEEEVDRWKACFPDQYASHRDMPDDAIPEDRTFRDAWCDVSPAAVIDHDMTKARGIHRNRMRRARAHKLAALDIAFMKAIEAGEDTAAIAAAKQELRDVTAAPEIDTAASPAELVEIWPAVLAD